MPFAVSVVGHSNSGKTTLLEKLIGELKRRGYHLATVKHTVSNFDLDQPGKDSWRFAKAGSDAVILSSARKVALLKPVDSELSIEELLCLLDGDFDLVLVEGFKNSSLPKIEVHRKGRDRLVCPPDDLLAVVTDEPLDTAVPQFSPDDVDSLVALLERELQAWREANDTMLAVNGTPVPLDAPAKSAIQEKLLEMVPASRGTEDIKSIRIYSRRGQV